MADNRVNRKAARQLLTSVTLAGMLAGIFYSAIQEKYLEAVAISCIGPVLVWFALGAGRASKGQEDTD